MDLNFYQMGLRIPALLIAITVHEYAHALVAYAYGDPTAKQQGRLTLNPIKHLDPLGTLMLLVAGIGWARPVPINPYRFRDRRGGLFAVSLAGPASNFITAFATILILVLLMRFRLPLLAIGMLEMIAVINIVLGVFNLIPIPPLDGSKVLAAVAPPAVLAVYRQVEAYAPLLLLFLIITGAFGKIIWPATKTIYTLMFEMIIRIPGLI